MNITRGVRNLVLYTFSKKYEDEVIKKLESRKIPYIKQDIGPRSVNLFFGNQECINAISFLADRPLYALTPEEDFILGALLGYDLCKQCERYCSKKRKTA